MADKKLLIVESPAKAKTINKYLGKNYIVEASVGHIKDLQKFRMGVDVENGFKPQYITIKGKADIIKKLQQLSKQSDEALIATDPDREGEAIAWHIAEELKKKNKNLKISRVLFNEITKEGIQRGIKNKLDIDENLFMAQQARRVMDRLIGYKVSPFLSKALLQVTSQPLSAGRVQSVALRLICDREKEIEAFIPIEYWNILADFKAAQGLLNSRLVFFDKNKITNPTGSAADEENKNLKLHYIKNKKQAEELTERIKKERFSISEIEKKKVKRNPPMPFTTSSLQQEASKRLGFSSKKTMMIAQKLYEGVEIGKEGSIGLITYMRTDSTRISKEAQDAAQNFINQNYGPTYLRDIPAKAQDKAGVQDAHEAIRPSIVDKKPADLKGALDKDEYALYELIYQRFLASQMSRAELEQTTIDIKGGDFIFRSSGSVVTFNGFLAAYNDLEEDTDKGKSILPQGLQEGLPLEIKKLEKQEAATKAPSRFTEASLVKTLDELGIGRPSTYAAIVSTLQDREYVNLISKAFHPTELGKHVSDALVKSFPDLFNVDFTAEMEKELDTIAEGDLSYEEMLKDFYTPFTKSLENAEHNGLIPEIPCPKCGAPMDIKVGRTGRFLGCSRYPDCTGTQPLPKGEKEKKEEKAPILVEDKKCPECGKPMYLRESRNGKFFGCTDYPNCKGILPFTTGVECPKCHQGEIVEKFSAKTKKKFWGCSRYPACDQISNYEPMPKECPNCHNYYLEIRFKKNNEGEWERYITCPSCKQKLTGA